MLYRSLGRSGLKVSAIGLGTNSFGGRADKTVAIEILHRAIDHGITFIDTANIYRNTASESIIGEGLKGKRHHVLLATKAGLRAGPGPNDIGSSRYHLTRELEGSLRRLRTDYVDLYQIHSFDPFTPLEETLATLDDMVRSGKVRYIGSSNYFAWELSKALCVSERRQLVSYISVQPSYSLLDRSIERELLPFCMDQGIGVIPYYPLAGGLLTGKYRPGEPLPEGSRAVKEPQFQDRMSEERLLAAQEVAAIAREASIDTSHLALAWLLTRPAVATVIVGASRPEQIGHNVRTTDITLTDSVLERLDQATHQFRFRPPFGEFRIKNTL